MKSGFDFFAGSVLTEELADGAGQDKGQKR
jgi:hypothetical protein